MSVKILNASKGFSKCSPAQNLPCSLLDIFSTDGIQLFAQVRILVLFQFISFFLFTISEMMLKNVDAGTTRPQDPHWSFVDVSSPCLMILGASSAIASEAHKTLWYLDQTQFIINPKPYLI